MCGKALFGLRAHKRLARYKKTPQFGLCYSLNELLENIKFVEDFQIFKKPNTPNQPNTKSKPNTKKSFVKYIYPILAKHVLNDIFQFLSLAVVLNSKTVVLSWVTHGQD